MTLEKLGKTGSPPFLQLEGSIGVSGDLGELKTGSKYRKETINTIKTNLSNWMRNDSFEPFRESKIDLAIVIKLSLGRLTCLQCTYQAQVGRLIRISSYHHSRVSNVVDMLHHSRLVFKACWT